MQFSVLVILLDGLEQLTSIEVTVISLVEFYATSIVRDVPEVTGDLDGAKYDENDETNDDDNHLNEVIPDGRFHATLQHNVVPLFQTAP